MKRIALIIAIALVSVCNAQDVDESQFYIETIQNTNKTVNIVNDFRAKPNDNQDDSQALQNAIDKVATNKTGGAVIIPKGEFILGGIELKTNVHIKIDQNAIIKIKSRKRGTYVFTLGVKNGPTVGNVSVRCLQEGKQYTADFSNIEGYQASLFNLNNVKNFLLADFKVLDNYTQFSALRFGLTEYNGDYYIPENGIVKNGTTINSHYGYGLIQVQAAKKILFKDLSGVGGATLRMETGSKISNDTQAGGVDGIVVRNISCKDGNSAVMVSPHALQNGTVDIDGVFAENTGAAVRIENGFIAKKYDPTKVSKIGTFKYVKVKNVKAISGKTAQLKAKHFKFIPCELLDDINKSSDAESSIGGINKIQIYNGPSIAAVMATHDFPVEISNVEAIGFKTKDIIYHEDTFKCEHPIVQRKGKNKNSKPKDKKDKKNKKKNKKGKNKEGKKLKNKKQ